MPLALIKTRIKAHLNALVPATLGEVQVDDNRTDVFDREIGMFPCAILTTPAITSELLTNRENLRTYEFVILVLQKAENVTSPTDTETLIETILNRFDNDPMLGGAAHGAVDPSSSPVGAVFSRGRSYIAFSITIRAKEAIGLTF